MDRIILRLMVDGSSRLEVHCTSSVRDTALAMLKRHAEIEDRNVNHFAFWVSALTGGFPGDYAGVRVTSEEPSPEWLVDFVLNKHGELEVSK